MSAGQIHIFVRDRDFGALGRGSFAMKQVLERLAWFADDDGMSVRPKLQTIADALGITKRAVRLRVRALEEKGFLILVEEARQHWPAVYRIDVEKVLSYPLTETGRRRLELENAALAREEKDAPQGGKVRHPGGKSTTAPIEEDSSQESGEESEGARAKPPRGARLPDDWQPGGWDFEFGRERGFSDQEVRDYAANFKTYFSAGPGRGKCYTRWSGHENSAFANWLRKERPRFASGAGAGHQGGGAGTHGGGGTGRDRRGDSPLAAALDRLTD